MYGNRNENLVERFEDWWRRDNKRLPLMELKACRDNAVWHMKEPDDPTVKYTDAAFRLGCMRDNLNNVLYLADSYASLEVNYGPGSLALYLGAEPRFAHDTVWYEPCFTEEEYEPDLRFDPENKWWKNHLALVRTLKEAAGDDFLVEIPDLIENLDILAAMRGPENTLFDIMDRPETVEKAVNQIDDAYFKYYDILYDTVRDKNGIAAYTAFGIIGKGRVAKIQCDFSAMISPDHFRRFVLPSLRKQAKRLDHSLYHLDGPDAIKHVPALMELEELDALQWTCGAGQPDGACDRWLPIYDQVAAAGKGLWVQLYDGGLDDWIAGAEKLMDRYGMKRFYFHFPWMSEKEAEKLLDHAGKHWAERA